VKKLLFTRDTLNYICGFKFIPIFLYRHLFPWYIYIHQ